MDTYGVPSYKEANPAVLTVVTFPFLFGVMFGDVCHGSMLLIFGLLVCCCNIKSLAGVKPYRYLILLMGIFSTYCGMLYNDFTSLPIEMFPSCYEGKELIDDCVYPFGIDWKWYQGRNNLTYFNSLKMKTSVIFGVVQMSIGICFKALNSIHFRKCLDLFFEFIPQIILMLVLFGYMNALIFVKWLTPWPDTSIAPSIISYMIDMFLKIGAITGEHLLYTKDINE